MTVPESLFWNESTVRCISNALLERDADTLVSLVQMRLEEILPRIASKGLQSVTAEQVSQEIGHLLVDAWGDTIDIDAMVDVLDLLKTRSMQFLMERSPLCVEDVQDKVRLFLDALVPDEPEEGPLIPTDVPLASDEIAVPTTPSVSSPPIGAGSGLPASEEHTDSKAESIIPRTKQKRAKKEIGDHEKSIEATGLDKEIIPKGEKKGSPYRGGTGGNEMWDGSLRLYLREIGKTDLLTPDQEVALAERIKCGDPEARSHMICANLRLVVKIAQDYVKALD